MIQIQRKDIKLRNVMRKTKTKYRRAELRKMVLVQNTIKKWREQHIDDLLPGHRIQRNEPVRNRCNPTIAPMPNQCNPTIAPNQCNSISVPVPNQCNVVIDEFDDERKKFTFFKTISNFFKLFLK
ncbi:hypothetical protein CDAR_262131 [Caerostris darwini]|uniref:Uncharacterized protein n=1 Tax=Caerostris darwini TaxID=1538125 RepID=A0AAV4P5A8_9ARAC|nr:hypothetical protein CDAR_262131 [Caerostris darwini]